MSRSETEPQAEAPDNHEYYGVPPYPDMAAIEVVADEQDVSSRERYCRKWGVHPDFLPFAGYHTNPIDILIVLRQISERKAVTASNIRMPDITDEMGANGSALSNVPLEALFNYLGGWQHPDELTANTGCRRWVNPEYKRTTGKETRGLGQYADLKADHRNVNINPEIVEERKQWMKIGLVLGLDGYQIARRMDVERHTVFSFCDNHDIDSRELIESGRELMLRTWKTAHEWGVPYDDLAAAAGVSKATLQTYFSRYIPDFEPPKDPTLSSSGKNIY